MKGKYITTAEESQAGFTLVELAIVMIIIGLLIGGVLKGQELITNAQVTGTVSQLKGFDAALTTFRDSYAALPGDMTDATVRLPNCTGNCANAPAGTGANNRIDGVPGAAAGVIGTEPVQAWIHLSNADLISGVDAAGAVGFGQVLPEGRIGGGYTLGFANGGTLTGQTGATPVRGGHYVTLTGVSNAAVNTANAMVISPSQAARMDRKMDDGAPGTGSMIAAQAAPNTCAITNAGALVYNEAVNGLSCATYTRIQQ